MKFEKDILISYACFNTEALLNGQSGWVSAFHESLEARLKQLLGRRVNIWRNNKLKEDNVFSKEIIDQFPKVAVLITILSPEYIESEWCKKELEAFEKAAQSNNPGITVNNLSRIFKIVKTQIPLENHPSIIRGLAGYEFFKKDGEKKYEEFKRNKNDLNPDDLDKLDDLCYDIRQVLHELEKTDINEEKDIAHLKYKEELNIYLAGTSSDIKDYRETIRKELQDHHHNVYPQDTLPPEMPFLESTIQKLIDQSDLSIHLVGNEYGVIPEGGGKSLPVLQNELAATASQKSFFPRLIWKLPNADPEDPKQKDFLEQLENSIQAQQGADVLSNNIEEFKYFIHDKINDIKTRKKSTKEKENFSGNAAPMVYLICDQKDYDDISEIQHCLFKYYNMEVVTSVYEGDENEIRSLHLSRLKLCDATLIYYGSASENWLRPKVQDLKKIAGYGRPKPLQNKAIYVAKPSNKQKEQLRVPGTFLINGLQGFEPKLLSEFVNNIIKMR